MRPHAFERRTATTVTLRGTELLAFAGTDYLGLAHHPEVIAACKRALDEHGLSPTAARHSSGGSVWHDQCEEALAEFLGVESALVLGAGWIADFAVGEAQQGSCRAALLDADAHPSLVSGARASGADCYDFGPGDLTRAHALIDRFGDATPSVWTDGVYPQVGRMAGLPDLLRVLPSDGTLVVDDSHGIGVTGPGGRGTATAFGLVDDRIVQTGSLGKSLGASGGFVAGSAQKVETIRRRSEVARTSAPPPPAACAAASKSLDIIQAEPTRIEGLHKNTNALHRIARRLGREQPGRFLPVLPLRLPDEATGRAVAAALIGHGLFVPWMRYPGTDGGCLRVAVNAEHSEAQVSRLASVLGEVLPGGGTSNA